jgi:hypothetical protein
VSITRGLVGGWRGEPGWRQQQSPFKGEHGGAKRKVGARFDDVHTEGGERSPVGAR